MRIVSLLPSATEIVYALGLGEDLVAVSHDCDYPLDVRNKMRLTSIDIEPSFASSREINEWVMGKLHRGTSIYHIDQQLLKKANPELVLTQELCEVCAPSFNDVRAAVKILDGEPKIVSLEPTSLEGIMENILTVGDVTAQSLEAEQVVSSLRKRIGKIANAAQRVKQKPRVLCLEWLDPFFNAGHWVPEMVETAGGIDVTGRLHKPSVRIEWSQIVGYDPDIVILMPCGFDLPRTVSESKALKSAEGWSKLRAVKSGMVFAVNGSAYFNRPGPRIVDGLGILAEILHAEIFRDLAPPESYTRLS